MSNSDFFYGMENLIGLESFSYQKKALSGQVVHFTYFVKLKTIAASILTSGNPIPVCSQDLPRELSLIQTPTAFINFFKERSFKVDTFGRGENQFNRIYFFGSLLGGNKSYKFALANLKKHLENLINPFLVADILKIFRQAIAGEINPYGMGHVLSHLPQETKQSLQYFSEKIKEKELSIKNDSIKGSKKLIKAKEHILKDLQTLAAIKLPPKFWKPLDTLLSLPQIKALKNSEIQHIISFIDCGHKKELKNYITILPNFKEIEKSIENTKFNTFKVLIKEIFNRKPKNKGINWKRTPGLFVYEKIIIINPANKDYFEGFIASCIPMEKEDGFIFYLEDGSKVSIRAKDYYVTLLKKIKLDLFSAVENKTIIEGEIIEFDTPVDYLNKENITPGHYKLLDSGSTKFLELEHVKTGKKYAFLANGDNSTQEISVMIWDEDKQVFNSTQKSISCKKFNKIYSFFKKEEVHIDCINPNNADQYFQIKNEVNKISILNDIKNRSRRMHKILADKTSSELLNRLVDNLIKNKLTTIDIPCFAHEEILIDIQEIIKKYERLTIPCTEAQILKTAVEDALYEVMINQEKSLLISKTMNLLKEALKHIKSIEGQKLILFLGNTGSGKSSSIKYFQGHKPKYTENSAGDTIVEFEDIKNLLSPTVGHSLNSSETVFIQGYPIGESFLLGDSPGFHDTRGEEYEFCSKLSLDQVVKKAEKISLVLTVPIQHFLIDKGNPVISLLEDIRVRFPLILSPKEKRNPFPLFFLITKKKQQKRETVRGFKSGKRLEDLSEQANQIVVDLKKAGAPSEQAEKNSEIWKGIYELFENKKIYLIDMDNPVERDKFLKRYKKACLKIEKDHYVPVMQFDDMQLCCECIETFAQTWNNAIFLPYTQEIPKDISKSQKNLKKIEIYCDKLQIELKAAEERLTKLMENEILAKATILSINSSNSNENLKNCFQKVEELLSLRKNQLSDSILQFGDRILSKRQELSEIQQELDNLAIEIKRMEGLIKDQNDLLEVVKSSYKSQYWEFKKTSEIDLLIDKKSIKAKDYRGYLEHTVLFENKVKLFFNARDLPKEIKNSDNIVLVEGVNFESDDNEVKLVNNYYAYNFKTIWKDKIIPQVTIYFIRSNKDYNKDKFKGCVRDFNKLTEQQFNVNEEFDEKTKIRNHFENELNQLEKEMNLSIEECDNLMMLDIKQEFLLKTLNIIIASSTAEKKATEEGIAAILKKLESYRSEKFDEEIKLQNLLRKKKNLAFIMHYELNTAKILREVENVISDLDFEKENIPFLKSLTFYDKIDEESKQYYLYGNTLKDLLKNKRLSMQAHYKEFLSLTTNIDDVEKECLEDLGLPLIKNDSEEKLSGEKEV